MIKHTKTFLLLAIVVLVLLLRDEILSLWSRSFTLCICHTAFTVTPKCLVVLLLLCVVAACLVLLIIKAIRGHRQKFFNDSPKPPTCFQNDDTEDVEDILGRKDIANIMAEKIRTDYQGQKNAVGIAVTGSWGSGKTTFLNYLRQSLSDCICVDFDPWADGSTNITHDLFNSILQSLGKDANNLSRDFKHYIQSVNVTNVTGWFSLAVLALKQYLGRIATAKEEKDRLKSSLSQLPKPIVVFIDDSDRLPGNGFAEVISLIRGIADLPNLVFIVAYDQDVASKRLADLGGTDFMSKLFNIIHPLQPISEDVIYKEVIKNAGKLLGYTIEADKYGIYPIFNNLQLKRYLPTLREVKRFNNMLDKDIKLMRSGKLDVTLDTDQWFTLELLKFTDSLTYFILQARPSEYLVEKRAFSFNDTYYALKDDYKVSTSETDTLLRTLFNKPARNSSPFQISSTTYFRSYFEDDPSEGFINLKELEACQKSLEDIDDEGSIDPVLFKTFVEDCYKNKRTRNLSSRLVEFLEEAPITLMIPRIADVVQAKMDYGKTGSSMNEIHWDDNYRPVAKVIHSNPYLACLAAEGLDNLYEIDWHRQFQDKMDQFCQECSCPEVAIALLNTYTSNWDYDGSRDAHYYLMELFKTLDRQGKHNELVWALSDCTSPILNESFLDAYLDDNFLKVLPFILRHSKSDEGDYLLFEPKAIEGLFITYTYFLKTMQRWKREQRYDAGLLDECVRLAGIQSLKPLRDDRFLSSSFPLLSQYAREQRYTYPPRLFSLNEDFWKDKVRLQEKADYYFACE